jgi:hypothetical protein
MRTVGVDKRLNGGGRFGGFGCGFSGRLIAGRLLGRPFDFSTLAPALDVGRGRRHRCVDELLPIERNAWILRFERTLRRRIEWSSSHLHVRRRAEPVENALTRLSAAVRGRLNERNLLVAPPIAREPEKRQRYFLFCFCGREGFFARFALAGGFVARAATLWRAGRAAAVAGRGAGRAGAGAAARGRGAGVVSRDRWTRVKRTSSPTVW